jgi:hypothetical protein
VLRGNLTTPSTTSAHFSEQPKQRALAKVSQKKQQLLLQSNPKPRPKIMRLPPKQERPIVVLLLETLWLRPRKFKQTEIQQTAISILKGFNLVSKTAIRKPLPAFK